MNYIAQSDVENYLGVTLTSVGAATFTLLLPLLQDVIDQYCNRTWVNTNPLTETFDALDMVGATAKSNYTFFPAAKISKTPADNAYPLAGGVISLTIGTSPVDLNYVVNYGTHVKLSASWPSVLLSNPLGFKMVTLVYNTDDTTVPSAVKAAFVMWMARMIQEAPDAGKVTNKVQTGTVIAQYNLDNIEMPKFVKMVLDNYRLPALDHF